MRKGLNIYISESFKKIIITPLLINKAGIYYESRQSRTLQLWPDLEELGFAIKESLELCQEIDINLRDRKSSDWPSYKQSRLKTRKEFKSNYSQILIMAFNETNLLYDASMFPESEEEISLHITINPIPIRLAEVGERIQKLFLKTKRFVNNILEDNSN